MFIYLSTVVSHISMLIKDVCRLGDSSAAMEAGVQHTGREPSQHKRSYLHQTPLREVSATMDVYIYTSYAYMPCYRNTYHSNTKY